MGHIQTIERELRALLEEGDTEQVVRWVKEKVLESYRNGQKAQGSTGSSSRDRKKKERTKDEQ